MDIERLKVSVLACNSTNEDIKIFGKRSFEGLRKWERSIVDRFMTPGKVLSIGCGGGREVFALEKCGYEITGIDVSKEQIEGAKKARDEINSTAQFTLYDGRQIPFGNSYFDAITLWSQVIGNVPGAEQRLSLIWECYRVLDKDGILSLSAHNIERTMPRLRESGTEFVELEGGDQGDLLLKMHDGLQCYWHYFTQKELRDLCCDAGFGIALESTSEQLGQEWDNLDIVVCKKG